MWDWLKNGLADIIKVTGKAIDDNVTSDEERLKLKNELEKLVSDAAFKMEQEGTKRMELQAGEMQSARDMFKANSNLQMIFAVTFLISYVIISIVFMLIFVYKTQLPPEGIAMLSAIFGGMSTKVGTITDFLFGSSLGSKTKDLK